VVSAAVALPREAGPWLAGVRDSKALTPARREALFERIRYAADAIGIGWARVSEVDSFNILQATFLSMRRALSRVPLAEAFVLVDGNRQVPGLSLPQRALVGGDDRSLCVGAASIVAKVLRDRWMRRLDRRYPGYGFSKHKGYGTEEHRRRIEALGPCSAHRRSFSPFRQEESRP